MAEQATKEDFAEIRAGHWDGYGDLTRLIHRLVAAVHAERRKSRDLRRSLRMNASSEEEK